MVAYGNNFLNYLIPPLRLQLKNTHSYWCMHALDILGWCECWYVISIGQLAVVFTYMYHWVVVCRKLHIEYINAVIGMPLIHKLYLTCLENHAKIKMLVSITSSKNVFLFSEYKMQHKNVKCKISTTQITFFEEFVRVDNSILGLYYFIC